MYWLWFWLVAIVVDAASWVVAMRLTKRRLWRGFDRRVKAAGVPLLLDESAVANIRGCPVQFFGLRWRGEAKGEDQDRDRFTHCKCAI